MRRGLATCAALVAVVAPLASAPGADATTRFYVRGHGFGHGVGLSQYGAYGSARHGRDYRFIVGHYYSHTRLGHVSARRVVRVRLMTAGAAAFKGATRAGSRHLSARSVYRVTAAGHRDVELRSARGRALARYRAPLRVTGPRPLRLYGTAENGVTDGRYRGGLEFRPVGGSVRSIDAVGLDDYVRGVVGGEVPYTWPAAALQAQVVASRTYGITATVPGHGYSLHADSSSQQYPGVSAERRTIDAAVRATSGQVVTYRGQPVITPYFSTSGGRTENVEDSFLGSPPAAWLVSVPDPYDGASPLHSWGPYSMTLARAGARLGGLVKGRFEGIAVTKRGRSPRVVRAVVLGSRGRTRVDGLALKSRLSLYDTWAYFTVIQTVAGRGRVLGRVQPGPRGTRVRIQRRRSAGWRTIATTRLGRRGAYSRRVARGHRYRLAYGALRGPAVLVG